MSLCECGCGESLPSRKYPSQGVCRYTGKPKRFIHGHSLKEHRGNRFVNGRFIDSNDRTTVLFHGHHRAFKSGYAHEHVLIAEKAYGKPLNKKHPVHHLDGNKRNNKNNNLVVCEDNAYHRYLHMRKSAFDSCGDPNWRRCRYCKQYDDPKYMYVYKNQTAAHHRHCQDIYQKRGLGAF